MIVMKSYSLGLLLVFFVALVCAKTLPRCPRGRTLTSQDDAEGKQPVLRQEDKTVVTSSVKGERINYERSHGVYHLWNFQGKKKPMTRSLRARGINGGNGMRKPQGKKNGAEAPLTKSTSVVQVHVTLVVLALIFLY